MSFSQWTISAGGAGSGSLETGSNKIAGNSSLVLDSDSGQSIVAALTSGAAVTTGTVRTMLKRPSAFEANAGVFGMMQTSISSTSNSYLVRADGTNIGLYKGTFLAGATLALVAHGLTLTGTNKVVALQLKWQRDPDSGFVVLNAAIAGPIASPATYDYSTLSTKITYTDNSSPYSSGVSAGVFARDNVTWYFEDTQIFRV